MLNIPVDRPPPAVLSNAVEAYNDPVGLNLGTIILNSKNSQNVIMHFTEMSRLDGSEEIICYVFGQ